MWIVWLLFQHTKNMLMRYRCRMDYWPQSKLNFLPDREIRIKIKIVIRDPDGQNVNK